MPWWTGTRIDLTHNTLRWYAITLQPTLWDTWECWVAWGRLGQCARGRPLLYEGSFAAALHVAVRQRHRKERRGYQTIGEVTKGRFPWSSHTVMAILLFRS